MDHAMQCQHPKDKQLLGSLLELNVVEQLFQWCRENHLDAAVLYAYRASCLEITEKSCPQVDALLRRACTFFGDIEPPLCFVTHQYEKKSELTGIFTPILLLSDAYIAHADPQCLYGTIAAQIAGIALGHQNGIGLSWIFRYCAGLLPIPGAALSAAEALLYQWSRCRWFSCDRGCLLATGDYTVALNTLFDFSIPADIQKRFQLGTTNDGYQEQCDLFFHASTGSNVANMLHSLQSDTTWTPERYRELQYFAQEQRPALRGGDGM